MCWWLIEDRVQPNESYMNRQVTLKLLWSTRWHHCHQLWVVLVLAQQVKNHLQLAVIARSQWLTPGDCWSTEEPSCERKKPMCSLIWCQYQMSHHDNPGFLGTRWVIITVAHFIWKIYVDDSSRAFFFLWLMHARCSLFTKICCICACAIKLHIRFMTMVWCRFSSWQMNL